MNYVVAIPSYERYKSISKRVLKFLEEGQVNPSCIFIFVSDTTQAELYTEHVPPQLYNKIVIGLKGLVPQRNFIRNYFPVDQYVVSLDDDVTRLKHVVNDKLVRIIDVDNFFKHAFKTLEQTGFYLWGIFPTSSTLHMKTAKEKISTDLRFIVGYCHGFITRRDKKLDLHIESTSKEDYEQSIRYWMLDGGVIRFNHICANNASTPRNGGLGKDRLSMSARASSYLKKTFPDNITEWLRPDGRPEVRLLIREPRFPVRPSSSTET